MLIVLSSFLGVLIGIYLTKATFEVKSVHDFVYITKIVLNDSSKLPKVVLISDIILGLTMIISATITLVGSYLLSESNQHPKILVHMVNYDLTDLLESSDYTYTKLITWNIYIWITFILILNDYLKNYMAIWLVTIFGTFAFIFTYLSFAIIEKHLKLISFVKKHEINKIG